MTIRILAPIALLCAFAPSLFAAPTLTIVPQGLQGDNFVWDVQITPDLAIAGGSTPVAVEMGFRLTTTPLVSVTNVSPLIFDTNNPGNSIFGWETPYPPANKPEGIEVNCAMCSINNLATFPPGGHPATVIPGSANEIFAAMGSIIIARPGPVTFLRIIGKGPANGGPSTSVIQWLGAYNGQGRISQINGNTAQNYDFSGTATQVPEPATVVLCVLGAVGTLLTSAQRRRA
jgi:hypothetical protein